MAFAARGVADSKTSLPALISHDCSEAQDFVTVVTIRRVQPGWSDGAGTDWLSTETACASKRSAVAREERRIGHLPPRTEARRLSPIGSRMANGFKEKAWCSWCSAAQETRGVVRRGKREFGCSGGLCGVALA